MKSLGLFAALAAAIGLVGAMGSSQPALAAVHCMRVYGVMAGFNGDTSIQYVELRMSLGSAYHLSSARSRERKA